MLIVRATSFFESEITQITDAGPRSLKLPLKTRIHGLLNGALIFSVEQDWSFGGATYRAGSLVAFTPDQLAGEADAAGSGHLILEPGARQSIEQAEVTATRVVAAVYDNVRGRIMSFEPRADGWRATDAPGGRRFLGRHRHGERDRRRPLLQRRGFPRAEQALAR